MSLTPGRARPPRQLPRGIGAFLAVILTVQVAPSGPARAAAQTPRSGDLVNWLHKHQSCQPAQAQDKTPNSADKQADPTSSDRPDKSAKKARAPRPPKTSDLPKMSETIDPAAADARRRGTIALNTGHYEEAIKAFEEAYALDQDPNLLFSLAQSYRLAGQPGKALEACSSFLRSANPNTTDRLQAERFMGEVAMIVYQLQLRRDLPSAPPTTPPSTEPPPTPTVAKREQETPVAAEEKPSGKSKEPRLDLTPRPVVTASDSLTVNPTPAEPKTEKHFYQSTTLWIVAGAIVVAGAGLGYWAYERSRGLPSPTTSLGYQPAFP